MTKKPNDVTHLYIDWQTTEKLSVEKLSKPVRRRYEYSHRESYMEYSPFQNEDYGSFWGD